MDQALLGPRCYFTSDPPLVELSPCSKGGQGEGEAAVIAHQPNNRLGELDLGESNDTGSLIYYANYTF